MATPSFKSSQLILSSTTPPSPPQIRPANGVTTPCKVLSSKEYRKTHHWMIVCAARRRLVRYDEDKEEDEFENNYDIVTLESYTEYKMNEALLVRAMVDNQEEQVLIFKGFSSSLSYGTSPDPSRSVLPAKAVITSIDRVKGPFDPSNVEYIEKGLTLDAFKTRLQPNVP
ncbi:hypothetical protein Scep_022742 [Stephania cephalantha]|uniref:DUF7734 domain-containing protein n=1 Tax=Stephania cephalantha TaxID=152367 RepID=A0AAP0HY31_9MAGN